MNAIILNREFQHPSDGWYMIEPKGTHINRAEGLVQIIDSEAMTGIANRFNAEADKPNFPGVLIDHEHFKHDQAKETTAYGWLMRLQNREDGIYAQIRWTKTGQAAVDGGDYRFFSTEYDPKDLQVVNDAKPRRVRPLRLDGLTLTNAPNNKGGKPITNRTQEFRTGNDAGADKKNKNQNHTMKSIASSLGLSADASEEAVLTEVTKLRNRAVKAEESLTPLQNRVTELETVNGKLLDDQIAADLSGVKDEKVRNRLAPVLKGMKNREERLAFLKDVVPAEPGSKGQNKLLNRDTHAPEGATNEGGSESQQRAIKIRNRTSELRGKGMSFDEAWTVAQQEINAAK